MESVGLCITPANENHLAQEHDKHGHAKKPKCLQHNFLLRFSCYSAFALPAVTCDPAFMAYVFINYGENQRNNVEVAGDRNDERPGIFWDIVGPSWQMVLLFLMGFRCFLVDHFLPAIEPCRPVPMPCVIDLTEEEYEDILVEEEEPSLHSERSFVKKVLKAGDDNF